MTTVAALPSAAGPQPVDPAAPVDHHTSFHDILSMLNPLQYLPVIGTIYRAATGDQIPEVARRVGSLIAGTLLGGPIGAAINVAIMIGEKITGIDLDQTGQMLLAGKEPPDLPGAAPTSAPSSIPTARTEAAAPAAAPPAAAPPAAAPPAAAAPAAASEAQAWSPAQLAAYGVSTAADGAVKLANLSGAEVLNALELLRVRGAQSAYGKALNLAG